MIGAFIIFKYVITHKLFGGLVSFLLVLFIKSLSKGIQFLKLIIYCEIILEQEI